MRFAPRSTCAIAVVPGDRRGDRAGDQRGLAGLASRAGGALPQRLGEDVADGARRERPGSVSLHHAANVVLVQRGGKPDDRDQRRQQGQRDLEGERARVAETVGGAEARHRVGSSRRRPHASQRLERLVALELTPGAVERLQPSSRSRASVGGVHADPATRSRGEPHAAGRRQNHETNSTGEGWNRDQPQTQLAAAAVSARSCSPALLLIAPGETPMTRLKARLNAASDR